MITEIEKKMEHQTKYKKIHRMNCLIDCRNSRRFWLSKSFNGAQARHVQITSLTSIGAASKVELVSDKHRVYTHCPIWKTKL